MKLACVVRDSWDCALYDLERDPPEHHDLIADAAYSAEVERLRGSLRAWFKARVEAGRLREIRPRDAKAREILRRAGYLWDDEP